MKLRLRCRSILLMISIVPALAQITTTEENSGWVHTFGSRVDLVLVPAIVSDAKGRHISGLKKAVFRLAENGNPQELSIFEEVTARKVDKNEVQPAPIQGFSNFAVKDTQAHYMTILVLDLLNTPFIY